MKVNFVKLNENAIVPTYGTEFSAGADLYNLPLSSARRTKRLLTAPSTSKRNILATAGMKAFTLGDILTIAKCNANSCLTLHTLNKATGKF